MVDWARNAEDKVTVSKSILSTGISGKGSRMKGKGAKDCWRAQWLKHLAVGPEVGRSHSPLCFLDRGLDSTIHRVLSSCEVQRLLAFRGDSLGTQLQP